MAYSTSNPPVLITQGIAGFRIWKYESVDAATLVRVSGYFTNGWQLGMRANDIVFVTDTDSSNGTTIHTVNSASSSGVDLTDGLAVGTTDTD
ncbi:hypothetical protein [Mesorhizobium sp.]|uniref:hypothetical protein n=1 Tax=Mesorhizobium sp. TaxID=1871066 RepID=UPI000FE59657|nr:hypothetical protein [Mesorhizobium sp.]RWF71870.1 MAG: hypothetical protein EOQ34_13935 [Mesorhizobium sp.]TIN03876.1 MAG: hypothetical protein E5Y38_06350 [Mesorhizobium sp.]TIQ95491.1 MAG: hypothetical protein E5X36_21835 [Mesorhizobium sp.]